MPKHVYPCMERLGSGKKGSGKALKAHGRVSCPGGPCFAAVWKPSKWTIATWPGAGTGLPLQGNVFALTWEGKALKGDGRVSCPGTVLRGGFKNLLNGLYGNMARRWEGSGKARLKAHGRVSCPGGPCSAAVLKPSKEIMATRPGGGKAMAKR